LVRLTAQLAANDREQFAARQSFHRDVAPLDSLALSYLSIATKIALFGFLGDDPQTSGTPLSSASLAASRKNSRGINLMLDRVTSPMKDASSAPSVDEIVRVRAA
jgi:hypothetical protein